MLKKQEETNNEEVSSEKAIYTEQKVWRYRGNPLIEALPPIFEQDQVIEMMSSVPEFQHGEDLSPNQRYHLIPAILQYYQGQIEHLDLEQRISACIRQSYVHRNPMDIERTKRAYESYRALKEGKFLKEYSNNINQVGIGFTIIGLSGVGKTTAIKRVLNNYTQVIKHERYNNRLFTFTQISWIILDCPHDGTIKGLCASFFSKLDSLLGSNYLYTFGRRNNSISAMLQKIVSLCELFGIGLLVIDEIQHLSTSKNGGADNMLSFFVTLVNTIGVAVILVGTNKAAPILQKEFRQARRGSGQGDMVWDRMRNDETWKLFISGLWEFQWTKKFVKLTPELNDLIYDKSQGIVDIAIKLFMVSQIRAISIGAEKLTVRIINDVYKDSFKLVKPMLDALRSGELSQIALYEDLAPVNFEMEFEKYRASINMKEKIYIQNKIQENRASKKQETLLEQVRKIFITMEYNLKDIDDAITKSLQAEGNDIDKLTLIKNTSVYLMDVETNKKSSLNRRKTLKRSSNSNLLLKFVEEAKENKTPIYDYLVEKNIIRKPSSEDWR
ncbi:ATP-binding protein [Planococcus sp. CPCC 101016]|uniref:ATP-binding protein n=1 Tax=Planococcus sp. CPCC 101016 TaxID=2599617 RepID=UPI0011B84FC4|nr:ATP-binding protein [Planococcus sp. CPCC 101016]TWT08191.1 ATP-binding protein [Planococcus sp. CPCC 101016]